MEGATDVTASGECGSASLQGKGQKRVRGGTKDGVQNRVQLISQAMGTDARSKVVLEGLYGLKLGEGVSDSKIGAEDMDRLSLGDDHAEADLAGASTPSPATSA